MAVRHDPLEGVHKGAGEEHRGVLCCQVSHVEPKGLLCKLSTAFAVVRPEPSVHTLYDVRLQPDSDLQSVLLFHISSKSLKRPYTAVKAAGIPCSSSLLQQNHGGTFSKRKNRRQYETLRKAPHCGALWPGRRGTPRRSFILVLFSVSHRFRQTVMAYAAPVLPHPNLHRWMIWRFQIHFAKCPKVWPVLCTQ